MFPVTWYERVCVFPRCSSLLGATQGLRKITLSCEWNCYFSVAINVYLSRDVCVRAHVIYVRNRNRISDKILLLLAISYLSWNTISLPNLMNISNELSAKNYEWQPWIPYQMTFGSRCFRFFLIVRWLSAKFWRDLYRADKSTKLYMVVA